MDMATIRTRVAAGYGAGAARLGVVGDQYRPTDALTPLATVYARPMMAFSDAAALAFRAPARWGLPLRYALMDTMDVVAGDILVADDDTYFVARVEAMRPAMVVLCDRVVSLTAASGSTTQVVAGCPAAIVMRSQGEREKSGMPGSQRPGSFVLFLPVLPAVTLTPYMVVTTDLGTSYTVVTVEPTSFGYRCLISMQQV